ncbi:MAG TPA: Rne/Rng family ribonuclease [Woeseiaceae bacterium]
MKRMLINATQEEELRMAMVDGQRLYDLNIELPSGERKKANIYKGKITRLEPSLEAAFVNYGAERHGFLPLKEISSEYFIADVPPGGRANIREVLKEGQDIVVQIDKEERGNKGAALTTFVSLAGRFIVLKPNKPRSGGVSRRIVGDDRDLARQSLQEIEVPDGMSVIVRTAGIDRSPEELKWDLDNLLSVWEAIKKVVVERPSPFLIYRESNAVIRALRDYMSDEIGEILIDDEKTYNEAREFIEQVMPQSLRKLKAYTDAVPLFTRFQIESQIESAFAHSVTLPSGGSLVIDHTEALVSIDINSARATKGGDIEATALNTNLEAADEVARQLRLRDLGGLVVIDFIDMGPQKNQRAVENRLREAVRQDRARVQIGKISRFGLLEMSRQRLRPSLGESSYLTCPRCSGIGNIRSVESLALAILRIIGEEARKERTAKVIAQLPVEVATYLLNEKRSWVQNLESRNGMQVVLIANSRLETPHYHVRRVRDDQVELPENMGTSYRLAEQVEEADPEQVVPERKVAEAAAVATLTPAQPAPVREEPREPGLFVRLFDALFGRGTPEAEDSRRHRAARRSSAESRGGQRTRRRSEGSQSSRKRSASSRGGEPRKSRSKSSDRKPGADESKGSERREARGPENREARSDRARDTRSPGNREARAGDRREPRAAEEREARQAPAPATGGAAPAGDGTGGTRSRDETGRSSSRRRSRGGRRRKRAGEGAAPAPAETPAFEAPPRDLQAAPAKVAEARPETREDASPRPSSAPAESRDGRLNDGAPAAEPAVTAGPAAAEPGAPRPERPASAIPARLEAFERPASATHEHPASEAPERAPSPAPERPEEPRSRPAGPESGTPAAREPSGSRLLPWEPAAPPADKPAPEPREAEKHLNEG